MSNSTAGLGRNVYGIAVLYFGVVSFVLHNYDDWLQLNSLGSTPGGLHLIFAMASCMIVGGLAIQWDKTARLAAGLLALTFLFFAVRWLPRIIEGPTVFDSYGNLFEQLSIVMGAVVVFAAADPVKAWSAAMARAAYVGFGICVVSFTLGQAVYLKETAAFVPAWVPPGQMFWAVVTTVAFAFAALALLTGIWANLAAQLLTLMILGFGVLVWLPRVINEPHAQLNWGGNGENMAIAGAAWIVADYVGSRQNIRGKKTT